jgi:glycosyltransferase involved in cell wall biosynthesis
MVGEKQNRFVFVAPMYNASAYVGQMLASIVSQSYSNWKVILIDDVSEPEHFEKQREIIRRWSMVADPHLKHDELSPVPLESRIVPGSSMRMLLAGGGMVTPPDARISWVGNVSKQWEVANVLFGIQMCCEDDDIVCRIDADDWLTEVDGLKILNAMYNATGAEALWTAHRWGYSDRNISGPLPPDADPYKHPWVSSHLKTFRKRLINGVPDINFRGEDGEYIKRAGDQAVYLPVLHNTKKRAFVPRVMYHYTINDVPETYQTPDARFQRDEAVFLRDRGYVK